MKQTQNHLAFDLGASSGRLMLAQYDGESIELTELHRFANEPVTMNGNIYWNIFQILSEMKKGLNIAARKNIIYHGIGIDTWGVDYGFLDEKDNLIGLPMTYRDERTATTIDEASRVVPLSEIYESTGTQIMNFNTIFQLISDKKVRPTIYNNAATYLSIVDLLNFYLTNEKRTEYTHASTTQMLNAKTRNWDFSLLERLSLRTDLFPPMIFPGEKIGELTKEVQLETGLSAIPVYAVGCHDTASAVAGTPLSDENAAFLSCGTWSLIGMELKEPLISDAVFQANFTNEGGVKNTYRFLKNINGLWILQQLRKKWNEKYNQQLSFPDIIDSVRNTKNDMFCIDPSDSVFMAPHDMVEEIINHCERKGQGTPKELGEIAKAIYKGLTNEYMMMIETLEKLVGNQISVIHMIGGGIQDELLCEMTAKTTNKTVIAGPVEGSVLGNVVLQLIASNQINDVSIGREIIKKSFKLKTFMP